METRIKFDIHVLGYCNVAIHMGFMGSLRGTWICGPVEPSWSTSSILPERVYKGKYKVTILFLPCPIFVMQPDVTFPLQPPDQQNCPMRKASLSLFHRILNDEIDSFWKQVGLN